MKKNSEIFCLLKVEVDMDWRSKGQKIKLRSII